MQASFFFVGHIHRARPFNSLVFGETEIKHITSILKDLKGERCWTSSLKITFVTSYFPVLSSTLSLYFYLLYDDINRRRKATTYERNHGNVQGAGEPCRRPTRTRRTYYGRYTSFINLIPHRLKRNSFIAVGVIPDERQMVTRKKIWSIVDIFHSLDDRRCEVFA